MKKLKKQIVWQYQGNMPNAGKQITLTINPRVYGQATIEANLLGMSVSRYLRIALLRGLFEAGVTADGFVENGIDEQFEELDQY